VSPLPGWLTDDDTAVLDEFAFKVHQCLAAMRDMRQRLRELETMEALKSTTWAMGLAQSNDVLKRLFLLAITAKQGLKFTRAILFLKKEEGDSVYEARFAVGSATRAAAEKVWAEMPDVPFQRMIDSCLEQPPAEGPDTLQAATVGLEIDLKIEEMIADGLNKGEMLIRRQDQPHIIGNPALVEMLSPQGTGVLEYVLAPLKHGGELHGILLADRAFLKDTRVPADDQAILGVICSEQMIVQEALTRRREAEGVAIAKTITTGLRHSLKSRVAILETRINDLAASLGGGQAAEVEKIRKSIDFLKRASILASRFPAAGILHEQAEIALDGLLHEVIQVLGDRRIQLTCDKKATVLGDREKLADAFLEVLTDCREFIDKDEGVVTIRMTEENGEARIEIRDNGPGIHPSIRDRLFQPFVCYPPEGIGLGLSLASAVFRAHGGKIEERGNSSKEPGAFFMVVLPLSEPERRN
jgi:signal transduction histidine kinase